MIGLIFVIGVTILCYRLMFKAEENTGGEGMVRKFSENGKEVPDASTKLVAGEESRKTAEAVFNSLGEVMGEKIGE